MKKIINSYDVILSVMNVVNEQEGGNTGGGESTSTATVTKWESGVKRGKANPIDSKIKWESGLTRGKANPIDSKTKWQSGLTRGKANPLS